MIPNARFDKIFFFKAKTRAKQTKISSGFVRRCIFFFFIFLLTEYSRSRRTNATDGGPGWGHSIRKTMLWQSSPFYFSGQAVESSLSFLFCHLWHLLLDVLLSPDRYCPQRGHRSQRNGADPVKMEAACSRHNSRAARHVLLMDCLLRACNPVNILVSAYVSSVTDLIEFWPFSIEVFNKITSVMLSRVTVGRGHITIWLPSDLSPYLDRNMD